MAKALRAVKEWKLATSYYKRGRNTGYLEKGVKRQNGKGGGVKGGVRKRGEGGRRRIVQTDHIALQDVIRYP